MPKLGPRFTERVQRSAFLVGALLFHLVLALMLIGYVVWQAPPAVKETSFSPTLLPPAQAAPSAPPALSSAPSMALATLHGASPDLGATMISPTPPLDFGKASDLAAGASLPDNPHALPKAATLGVAPRLNLAAIRQTVESWKVPGKADFMRFPIYLAKYADGDWDCNNYSHDGRLTSGALPNLLARVHEWSHGELDGREIKVVALDSPEILTNPPPFIFITGHRDFHLTPAEIANLAKYLSIGGAVWGDSAFAGDGSRFDVAFKREMKLVLPDADLQFEPLPADAPIFTSASQFDLGGVPLGMNRRADPIEAIHLDGKLAVLYTPNDDGDMLTMVLQPGLDEREAQMDRDTRWAPDHPLYTNGSFVFHQASFFRNYQPDSVMTTYKLSMNILVYLLHRYDDELLLAP
jgi:hypothetical protein